MVVNLVCAYTKKQIWFLGLLFWMAGMDHYSEKIRHTDTKKRKKYASCLSAISLQAIKGVLREIVCKDIYKVYLCVQRGSL